MKRVLDISLLLFASILLFIPFILAVLAVKFSSKGPVLYWSDRVGKNNRIFKMPKLRSMRVETPVLASDLLQNPEQWITPVGSFLRKSSLDELPQFWNILRGEMSFVGPRPALFNQDDLIELRTKFGIHQLTPGLTGWAQVNGRDDIPIPQKIRFDNEYLKNYSIQFDMKILWLTVIKVIRREGITH
jgi:O-antigen biosynthesis protein WbqP